MFAVSADPISTGIVASLARPGGNVTGLSDHHGEMAPKRLELLKEIAPNASEIAVLWNPVVRHHQRQLDAMRAAAPAVGVTIRAVEVRNLGEFDAAFAALRRSPPGGLAIVGTSLMSSRMGRIAAFTLETRLPAIYTIAKFPDAGGLMSYGTNFNALYRRAAHFVDKILKGAKPADLPVEQPTTFDLVVNLKTAKAIGVTVPASILLRANRVIE